MGNFGEDSKANQIAVGKQSRQRQTAMLDLYKMSSILILMRAAFVVNYLFTLNCLA